MKSKLDDHKMYIIDFFQKLRITLSLANILFIGFRKNDIITIVSQRDEHCWVGELNGLTGWFPAKLVQILDERR